MEAVLEQDMIAELDKVRKASRQLSILGLDKINAILNDLADLAEQETETLLVENKKDLDRMDSSDPKYDRLMLTEDRIRDIASDLRGVAKLDYPVGKILTEKTLPNGLITQKITVPLGVIGVIFESRPNVTFDVFSLCLKSGNCSVLKGSGDAIYSNKAIVALIHQTLKKHNVSEDCAYLTPPEREATHTLLNAVGYVDIVIPRGSQGLIDFVRDNAKVPVIETGAGIVHTYFDVSGDAEKGRDIITNAKTRRVSVCNALDCLVLHEGRVKDLRLLTSGVLEKGVEVFADEASYKELDGYYDSKLLKKADDKSFGTEFLSMRMSIKTVKNLDEALDHIADYSSKHSEAIVAEDQETVDLFIKSVDAAAVYSNSSTAFTDGSQFGLGAEIGISTQKLHARGPMALEELTSYKWVIKGTGQVRD